MNEETKNCIAAINSGIIPEGYKKTKVGIVPVEWEIVKLANIMHNEPRPVDKPNEPYIRIGIRSHAKGTFQELVENPAEVNMDTLYVVKKDDIVVNITFAWEHAIALASEEDDGKLVSHRFPTYVFDNNSPLYYKYVFFQDMFRQRLELISPGGAGRNRVLNKTDFINLEIYHPPLPEQQKIAEILSTQDKLIELQEKKIEQLKELKKAYLQKMFPKKGSKYPELRFKGFTDPWEQRELGEWGEFYYGHSCPKWSVTEDATTPCIRYGELYTKFGTKIDKVFSYTNMPKENLRFSKGTEVLIPRVGEDPMDYNHCTWLSIPNVAIGEMISVYNTKQNPLFTATMFNATLQKEFAMRVEGGGVTNLYYEKLKNIQVSFPKYEEQEQIASFFEHLDNLITLHHRKSEQEKQKKKALMQLLLTGKVRCI